MILPLHLYLYVRLDAVMPGFSLEEPATDIAVAVAIASGYIERPVPRDTVFVGELGLGGELHFVAQLKRRLFEASKLGFKKCIVPQELAPAAKEWSHGSSGCVFGRRRGVWCTYNLAAYTNFKCSKARSSNMIGGLDCSLSLNKHHPEEGGGAVIVSYLGQCSCDPFLVVQS
ncbi:hypothetical protein SELMODRAFT_416661 [Selaginella moellendorffii]|uniref:Lon proteolytic domain-containing protein n=1 Tax=Selaginella moellendorffii TaxID=88036 RepID=D8S004_SELML|nr:hypothetical protein SELMODRAFT_416661 [Selaginella moellendorffii]